MKIKLMAFIKGKMVPLHLDDWTFFDGELCHRNAPFYPVVQYTEVNDKNGKEVYDGHIVIIPDELRKEFVRARISFDLGTYWFSDIQAKAKGRSSISFYNFFAGDFPMVPSHDSRSIEIIGNVYENPELLK